MKNLSKRIATIAATLALVVVLGITLAACGSKSYKELTMEEYQANLEAAGYSVDVAEKSDFSYWASMFMIEGEMVEDIDWMMRAVDEEEDMALAMVRFNTTDNAKDVVKKFEDYMSESLKEAKAEFNEATKDMDKKSDEYKALKEEFDEGVALMNSTKIVRAGNVAMFGTKAGVDAAYTTAK